MLGFRFAITRVIERVSEVKETRLMNFEPLRWLNLIVFEEGFRRQFISCRLGRQP